jgi:hypothetical protein
VGGITLSVAFGYNPLNGRLGITEKGRDMDSAVRACVAYIAGRLSTGQDSSAVYDYSERKHRSISGDVSDVHVGVYDYARHAHISGGGQSLYDHKEQCHIQLNVNGAHFDGYEYKTHSHFQGTVSGNGISLYDFKEQKYFNYSI